MITSFQQKGIMPILVRMVAHPMKKYGLVLGFMFPWVVLAQTTIIENVSYLDVEESRVVENAHILVEGATITQISRRPLRGYADAVRVDGAGKYMMPGLVDSNINISQSGGLYARPDIITLKERDYANEVIYTRGQAKDLFQRYIRLGITTVMDLGGPFSNFEIREELSDQPGMLTYYTMGPLISTHQPRAFPTEDPPIIEIHTPQEAIALVQRQLPHNPDFITVWYTMGPRDHPKRLFPILLAVAQEAAKYGLPLAIHARQLETAKLAITAGAGYLIHSLDEPVDDELITMMLEHDVVLCPSLIASEKIAEVFSQQNRLTEMDFQWANPFILGTLFDLKHASDTTTVDNHRGQMEQYQAPGGSGEQLSKMHTENLKKLAEAGVKIATGTGAGIIGTQHASSYFAELQSMSEAGMSNWEILKASTLIPAEVMGATGGWGSIAEGKRADLVLYDQNPAEDLSALQQPTLVVKAGMLISTDTLLPDSPEVLVQRQLNGYNARDMDAYLEPYADTVKQYRMGYETPFMVGKDAIRESLSGVFNAVTELHCKLIQRMVHKNTVIDEVQITGFDGGRILHGMAIYTCERGKIVEVRFVNPRPYLGPHTPPKQ
ncbi:MAG: amidohydrolase family protein [Bacteroidota bacterium]